MDRQHLEALKANAEQRCTELFNQVQSATTELERYRGEFRIYEALLLRLPEDSTPEAEIVEPKKVKKEK